MSYDISFFRPDDAPPLSEDEKADLAAALCKLVPELVAIHPDIPALAQSPKVSEDDARIRFSQIELNQEPQPGEGIQITIDSSLVSIAIPYWHRGPEARRAFEKIARCGRELASRGYTCADNQLDKEVDFSADLDVILDTYLGTTDQLQSVISKAGGKILFPGQPKKPWWKFW